MYKLVIYFTKTMAKNVILVLIICFFISCKSDKMANYQKEYLRHVGDIELDSLKDNNNFKTCNGDDKVFQYFNLGNGPVYVGEKSALLRTFQTKYKPVLNKNQNGLIRIRFIVNCEGQAGRFRVLQSDSNFNETKFDEKIVSQLTEITKGIKDWVILYNKNDNPIDYYFYLVFKIDDGKILEILP